MTITDASDPEPQTATAIEVSSEGGMPPRDPACPSRFRLLESAHAMEMIIYIMEHDGCRRCDIYSDVSHNQSTPRKLDALEESGLIVPRMLGRARTYTLSEKGRRVAVLLAEIRDTLNGSSRPEAVQQGSDDDRGERLRHIHRARSSNCTAPMHTRCALSMLPCLQEMRIMVTATEGAVLGETMLKYYKGRKVDEVDRKVLDNLCRASYIRYYTKNGCLFAGPTDTGRSIRPRLKVRIRRRLGLT